MNKKRILGLVGGATLIIAIVLVALGFNAAPKAKGSNASLTTAAAEVEMFNAAWWNNARIRSGVSEISSNAAALDSQTLRSSGNPTVTKYGPPGR